MSWENITNKYNSLNSSPTLFRTLEGDDIHGLLGDGAVGVC